MTEKKDNLPTRMATVIVIMVATVGSLSLGKELTLREWPPLCAYALFPSIIGALVFLSYMGAKLLGENSND